MVNAIAGQFGSVPLKYFGDWTDRIAKGELPQAKPPRPAGVERNLVVTTWDWGSEKKYLHDLISTDKRNPTVNAIRQALRLDRICERPSAGARSEDASRFAYITPPDGCRVCPRRSGPDMPPSAKPMAPSAYWGMEQIWDTQVQQPQRHDRRPRAGCG